MLPRSRLINLSSSPRFKTSKLSEFFIFKTQENYKNYARFAFVISKKIEKTAVNRNKTKRILSQVIQNNLSQFKSNYDILIIIRKPILGLDNIETRFMDASRKADMLI